VLTLAARWRLLFGNGHAVRFSLLFLLLFGVFKRNGGLVYYCPSPTRSCVRSMNDCDGRHLTHAVFYIVTHLLSFTVDGRRKDDEGIPSPPILYCRYPSSSSSPCSNRLDISSIYKYFRQVDTSIRPERSSSVYHSTHTFRMVLHRSTPKQPTKVKQHAQRCADIDVLSDPCQMGSVAIA
jgi:hypothetical protein